MENGILSHNKIFLPLELWNQTQSKYKSKAEKEISSLLWVDIMIVLANFQLNTLEFVYVAKGKILFCFCISFDGSYVTLWSAHHSAHFSTTFYFVVDLRH